MLRRPAELDPIPGAPVLELRSERSDRPTLLIADLHLGLGGLSPRVGRSDDTLARDLAFELVAIGGRRNAGGFIVLGDVKHPIVGVPGPLRTVIFDFFSTLLSEGFRAEVVLGNHDVGLARVLPKEVKVHPAAGIVRDGVGLFHGHRWPSRSVLSASTLVMGHLHPGFRFAPTSDAPAGKLRCWVRAERTPDPPRSGPRGRRRIAAGQVVVLPAFNPIAGAEALNRERPARGRSFLVRRFLGGTRPRAYLLDGTDLGEVLSPDAPGPRRAHRGAPPAP